MRRRLWSVCLGLTEVRPAAEMKGDSVVNRSLWALLDLTSVVVSQTYREAPHRTR